jgi:aspartyl-tRNA(Asn)/glutamyl-tRNA(Gln) amidotransferase subunit A
MNSIEFNSITEAKEALDQKRLSVTELINLFFDLIKETDQNYHCFLELNYDSAIRQAQAIDQDFENKISKPLKGIPIALKDNIVTKGLRTTCGSKILQSWIPPYDATVVKKLKEAGAIVVGKTNMDEFAMGSSTEYSAFGPTKNPLDTSCVPGGSSGGSAAAIAASLSLGALGSDTGGSIRQPAAFCGVVGVKPTYGRVSRFGLVAFASSLDQIGPFARNVNDAALLLDVVSGNDPMDSTSLNVAATNFFKSLNSEVAGLKVGLIKELTDQCDQVVKETIQRLCDLLADYNVVISEISMPSLEYSLPAYYLIAPAEASSNLARFDGVRYGLRIDGSSAKDMMIKTRTEGFGNEVKRRIMLGTYVLSHGYYDAYYLKALKVRTLIKKEFEKAYQNYDLLICPTTPTLPFKLGERMADPVSMYLSDLCTIPSNLAGHPSISVPFGPKVKNFQVGIQVLANELDEQKMFNLAKFIEEADE